MFKEEPESNSPKNPRKIKISY